MSSPTVLLSPRPKVRLPTVDIDIPPPPPVPARPGGSLLYQILPVLLAAVGMGVILVVSNAQGSSGTLAVLMLGSLLLVGGGAGATLLMHRSQNAAYRRGLRERLDLYYRMLASTRDRLLELLDEQRRTLLDKDPEPDACASIAPERGPRLWERSPSDSDFLVLRAGLGAQPSSVAVRAPRQPDPLVPDPLVEGAAALAAWASSVWSVPVSVSLVDAASTGVYGPSPVVLETVRALLVQLVTHHAPDEVKLVALVPHAEMTDWAWLRWLPHVWSDDRRERYIATTPDESRTLSKRLEELLGRPRDLFAGFGAERSNGKLSTPVYVFLIADAGLADHMPLLAEISASEISRLGATCLFLAPDRRLLPRACRTIVELSEDGADGRLVRPDGDVQGISARDLAPLLPVEQLATALSSLHTPTTA